MAAFVGVRKVRRLPNDGMKNGWYESLPPPPEARRVAGTVTVDWAVIGAGVCGLAFARRLGGRRPSDSVAVVEAMRVGYGSVTSKHGFDSLDNFDVIGTQFGRVHFTAFLALVWLVPSAPIKSEIVLGPDERARIVDHFQNARV